MKRVRLLKRMWIGERYRVDECAKICTLSWIAVTKQLDLKKNRTAFVRGRHTGPSMVDASRGFSLYKQSNLQKITLEIEYIYIFASETLKIPHCCSYF